jgi:hypothetical protein
MVVRVVRHQFQGLLFLMQVVVVALVVTLLASAASAVAVMAGNPEPTLLLEQ